ncbi:TPA: hypothetical protein ACGD74_002718 [Serratia marcescens]
MANEYLKGIHSKYYEYQQKKKIGMGISIAGVLLIISGVLWYPMESKVVQGVILGGGLVYWVMYWEKFNAIKKELDMYCREHFGKDYLQSITEVINEEYGQGGS